MTFVGIGVAMKNNGAAIAESPAAPSNIIAPTVTGTGYVGYTLVTTDGVWGGLPAPTFTYQWQRNGVDIGGATASTYEVTLADEGVPVRCVVAATNSEGSASANSNAIEQWVLSDVTAFGAVLENWFDAEDSTTITIATGVSSWAGKGSMLDTITQGTGSRQPVYEAAGFSGRPCLAFDRALQHHLQTGALKDRLRNVGAAVFAISAGNVSASARLAAVQVFGASGVNRMAALNNDFIPAINTRTTRLDSFSPDESVGLTPSYAPSAWLAIADFANDIKGVRQDGVENVNSLGSAGNTDDTVSTQLRLGGVNGNFSFNSWSGQIHEVAVISGSVSSSLLDKLDGYLAWRGRTVEALDAGSPYKLQAPTP